MHKFVRVNDFIEKIPDAGPPNGFEAGARIAAPWRVIVGVSIRAHPGTVTTMVVGARRLNPNTGKLEGDVIKHFEGSAPSHPLEVSINANNVPNGSNRVLGGFWVRAQPGNVTSVTLWTKSINEDGHLEGLLPVRTGPVPHPPNGFEVEKILSGNYVIVSLAFRAQPGNVTHLKGMYSELKRG